MTLKLLCSLLLAGVSVSACAQAPAPDAAAAKPGATAAASQLAAAAPANNGFPPGTPEHRAREAIRNLSQEAVVEHLGPAPIPGFREAIVGGQVLYISDDGKYLIQGALVDLQNKKNLGEAALSKVRSKLMESIPVSDRIVFAPPNPKYTVAIFTDVECGYCRKMHSEIAQYNQQGIAVEYLAFPRMGLASEDFRKMEAVWCAKDRKKALTDAKNDRKVPAATCKNPVAMQYHLGQRAGLTGTPMILTRDGTQLGGYLPAAELRAALDKQAAESAPKANADA